MAPRSTSQRYRTAVALRDVENRPNSAEAAVAHRISGVTRWYEGNCIEARRYHEQALAFYNAVRDREPIFRFSHDQTAVCLGSLAQVLVPLGVLDRAGSLIEAAVTRALETRHVPTIAHLHAMAGAIEIIRRDRPWTAHYEQVLPRLAREHGMADWLAFATFVNGWSRSGGTDRDAGLAEMRLGMTLYRFAAA